MRSEANRVIQEVRTNRVIQEVRTGKTLNEQIWASVDNEDLALMIYSGVLVIVGLRH